MIAKFIEGPRGVVRVYYSSPDLSARHLAKHGLRRGAYDGAHKRRFVIFEKAEHNGERIERRYEYDTKRARDAVCIAILGRKENEAAQ